MADDTVTKIAIAGLLHDIGKLAQGCLKISPQYRQDNEDIFQPKFDGRPSHVHGLYTAAFIEEVAQWLPDELSARQWGDGEVEDTLLNLAACHHNPHTAMQWVIAVADRVASGLDRATFKKGEAIAVKDFRRTRLLPVLEGLGPEKCASGKFNQVEDFTQRYPSTPLSVHSIFPQAVTQVDGKEAEEDYHRLFTRFQEELALLEHRRDNVQIWAEHLDSLLMKFTSLVPAARVGDVVYDVSLYDHCRATSALAAALYLYHQATGTLNETAIKQEDEQKLLLVSGDFYGIQDFIFSGGGETRKFRSKLLRGRSFAVSLFSELAADMVCRALNLPFTAVVMNAAGKFHLLAPNLPEAITAIKQAEQEINEWLFTASYGQSSLGISYTAAGLKDFHAGGFADLWDRHLQNIELRKFRKLDLGRHGGAVGNYLDQFVNDEQAVQKPLCPLCGKRPSSRAAEKDRIFHHPTSSCEICRDHVFLGQKLVRNPRVAVCAASGHELKEDQCLRRPIFGRYQIGFTEGSMKAQAASGALLKLWQVKVADDGTLPVGVTTRLLNGYVPLYREEDNHDECLLAGTRSEEKTLDIIEQIKEGVPKTFSHIAMKARHISADGKCRGAEALGVLKADIDNLGMLFGCGLPKERFTLSRLATISRQLDNFFVLYLPSLLINDERFQDVYTVFAGGDDLFLIGPWDRMAVLADHLRRQFEKYVGNNPEITFSAGITTHKPHVPLDKLAEAAEEALGMAKKAGRQSSNSGWITMFGERVDWDTFGELLQNQAAMEQWLEQGYISDVMFYRFNQFVTMGEMEQQIGTAKTVRPEDMDCLKWRALFRYNLARNLHRDCGDKERDELLQMAQWITDYRGAVRIPLWHVLYGKRK